jgi:hypothetical protein
VIFRTQGPFEFSRVLLLDSLGVRFLIGVYLDPDQSACHGGWLEVAERLLKKPLLLANPLLRGVYADPNLLRALVARLASRQVEFAVQVRGDLGCRGCFGRSLRRFRGFFRRWR